MPINDISINHNSTALVIIDLQKGIVGMDTRPHSAKTVVANSAKLIAKFREKEMPIFFVHVDTGKGVPLQIITDSTLTRGEWPKDWAEFVPELGVKDSDLIITKRQWGAFYGTDLEQQLRRRKIDTIILCGIATTYGVESTARFAYEFGFNQIFVEDAITDMAEESHKVTVDFVLKRIGRVRSTENVLSAL